MRGAKIIIIILTSNVVKDVPGAISVTVLCSYWLITVKGEVDFYC
jgi:hypothetical protein